MILKDAKVKLKNQVTGLIKEYEKVKGIFDNAGLNAELKNEALNGMANALQLQSVALQNFSTMLQIEAYLEDRKKNTTSE